MSKAANIYWDNSNGSVSRRQATTRPRRARAKADQRTAPSWLPYVIVASIFVMLIISINFRSFMEMREEVEQNQRLSAQIQSLTDENLALQEEIHTLKSDPAAIGREAKRIGIDVKQVAGGQ